MANDIAKQFEHVPAEQAAQQVAGHIRAFWDPRMRAEFAASDGDELDPIAAAARELIAGR
jgi:formate dehydrogenase subunit delta